MTRRFTLFLVPMLVAVLTPAAPLGRATVVRIIQTNAAGDNAHVIDPDHEQGGRDHQGRGDRPRRDVGA